MTKSPPPVPTGLDAAATELEPVRAHRNAPNASLPDQNKTVLFDTLEAHSIHHVVVRFDGYGDSGQIESIEAKRGDEVVDLPKIDITLALVDCNTSDPAPYTLPICDAVEQLVYEFLEEAHHGWENNDGAYGDFVFDVGARTIMLDYNERYTASENYTHEF